MYIPGVYNGVVANIIIENDIRCEEVRKILTSFSKSGYAAVYPDRVDIIIDNTVLYKTTLKTPSNTNLPTLYIDIETLLGLPEDKLVSCPWVEQNYNYTMGRMIFGPMVGAKYGLRSDLEFENLLALKSADGMRFYKVPGFDKNKVYMIPVFTGFPNLNKQDTASVEIYANDGISVIVDMTIFKKKLNRDIHMIYKILDITQ